MSREENRGAGQCLGHCRPSVKSSFIGNSLLSHLSTPDAEMDVVKRVETMQLFCWFSPLALDAKQDQNSQHML